MSFRKGFAAGTRAFGERVSMIVNTLLLLVVYVVGVGLPAILGKLTGKRFLSTEKQESYWVAIPREDDKEGRYRQF